MTFHLFPLADFIFVQIFWGLMPAEICMKFLCRPHLPGACWELNQLNTQLEAETPPTLPGDSPVKSTQKIHGLVESVPLFVARCSEAGVLIYAGKLEGRQEGSC